jgi:MFS family permease
MRRAALAMYALVVFGLSYVLRHDLGAGSGIGLTFVPMTMAATADVVPHEAGLASGLINTSRQIGGAVGLAALATVATTAAAHHAPDTHVVAAALTHGYDQAFLIMAGIAITGASIALLLPRSGAVHTRPHIQTTRTARGQTADGAEQGQR